MGKTKNSRRMTAKGGKPARGMVVFPIASSSSKAASGPESSSTSNAVLPPPINDPDSTQEESSERDHNTATESRPRTKLISKEQKDFLNRIQFAVYTTSTNLHDFFNTIEDEHLPAAIEHVEFLHGREVEEQLNRNQSRLPDDPLFSLPAAPDPSEEDLQASRTHLVNSARRMRELQRVNQESAENAPFASNTSPEPTNRPREALDERARELTSYVCSVCGKYISIVRFTCVNKGCKTCKKREESEKWGRRRNVWCSRECWEIRSLGADGWGECEVRAEGVGHVGPGGGGEGDGVGEGEEGGDEEVAVRGVREWRVVEGEKEDERGRKRYELKRVEREVDR